MPRSTMRKVCLFCLVALVGAVLVSGCAFWHSGTVGHTVDEPYEHVFRGALEMLRGREFEIRTADREAGRIETERRAIEDSRVRGPVEKATVTLKPKGDGQTKVKLLLVFVDQADGRPVPVPQDGDGERGDDIAAAVMDRAYGTGAVYDNYLDGIERRARKQREE